jgi:hypothetical protein
MLSLEHNSLTGETRLAIQNAIAPAWISYYPPPHDARDRHDWRMYVKRKPDEPALAFKSPTRLLIESRLRAWLLQRFRRRLRDLRFAELCRIAEQAGKHPAPRRRVNL